MHVKRTKTEQSVATRSALVTAGREIFAERGFADAATSEIVRRAGVTRGALYYHFPNKEDLFLAVFEDVERDIVAQVAAAAMHAQGPWEVLLRGSQAFLDACLDPVVQRVVLIDAPSVLGYETWREVDARYGLGLVTAVLQEAVKSGVLEPQPVEPLAHMLLGALNEAALLMARSPDPVAARAEVGATLERLLRALRAG